MKKIHFFTLALFLLGYSFTFAQNTDGKDFWVTFGGNWAPSNGPLFLPTATNLQLQLRIVSRDKPTVVTIEFTDLGPAHTIILTMPARYVETINLNNTQKTAVYNNFTATETTTSRSVHITSTQPVTAYAMSQGYRSTDATNILPAPVLGKEYYHISYRPRSVTGNTPPPRDAYAVIATEDDTDIFLGEVFVKTLQTGQVYYRTSTSDMTGAYITADKPVAFFALNQNVIIPSGSSGDCLMQQLSPVITWGTEFFVPVSHLGRDRVRIVASQDGTNITVPPGVTPQNVQGAQMSLNNLQRGKFVELEINIANNGCYIETNFPVGICTYLLTNSNNYSDPSQAWLPSINQKASKAMIAPFIPGGPPGSSNLTDHFALIITPSETKEFTQYASGNTIFQNLPNPNDWKDNTAAGISFYSLELNNTSYQFKNPHGIIVMGYGAGTYESYYYLGYSSMRKTGAEFYADNVPYWELENNPACKSQIEIRAELEEIESMSELRWYIDDVLQNEWTNSLTWTYYPTPGEHEMVMEIDFVNGDSESFSGILLGGWNISVSVSPAGVGTINGGGCYDNDIPVTLIATPASDLYKFVKWTENGVSVSEDAEYGFTTEGNRTLVAHFELVTYLVTATGEPDGFGTVTGGGEIPHGYSTTVSATPHYGYKFVCWTENDDTISTNPIYKIDAVTEPHDLVAHFAPKNYTITVAPEPTMYGDAFGGGIFLFGDTITVTAVPNPAYRFVRWTEYGVPVSFMANYTFIVDGERDLVAHFEPEPFIIRVAPNNPNWGDVCCNYNEVTWGESRAISAHPYIGYNFIRWAEDGYTVSTQAEFILEDIGKSWDLVAFFTPKAYNIQLSSNPGAGGTTSGGGLYFYGQTATVIAEPNATWKFVNWTDGNDTVCKTPEYSFPVTENRNLVANFERESYFVALNVNPSDGGSAEGGGYFIPHGSETTVSAFPNYPKYEFDNWTDEDGTVLSVANPFSFSVIKSQTLTANFKLRTFNIVLSASPAAGGTFIGEDTNIPYGEERTVEAFTNPGYFFIKWTEGGTQVSTNPEYSFSVTQNRNLVAHFSNETFNITVSANPTEGGTVSGGDTNIPYLTEIIVSAIPDPCYNFTGWTENSVTIFTELDYPIVVTENRDLVANFVLKTFTVTTSVTPAGGGTASGGGSNLPCDEYVTVYANPETDFFFLYWTIDGGFVSDELEYTFLLYENLHLVAHFEHVSYTVTTSANPTEGGSTFGDATNIPYLDFITVSAISEECYDFVNWTENGIPVSTEPDYTFQVTANRDLIANFIIKTFTVTTSENPETGGTASGGGTNLPCGEYVTVYANPETDFFFLYWTIDGDIVSYDSEYTFLLYENLHLVAHFEHNPCTVITLSNPLPGGYTFGGGIDIPYLSQITVFAIPEECYTFVDWTEDGETVSTELEYTFTVTQSTTLTANFSPHISMVTASADPPEAATLSFDTIYPACETEITVTAYPEIGYKLIGWTFDDIVLPTNELSFTFTVTGDHTVVANFVYVTYTIDLWVNPFLFGGSVQGEGVYPHGEDITVYAFPNPEYKFFNWTEDGEEVSTSDEYTFTVTADRFLVANFVPKTINITVEAKPPYGGTATGDTLNIPYGAYHTVSAAANEYFVFVNWTENGVEVSKLDTFSFIVSYDRHLVANFELIKYNIVVLSTDGGIAEGGGSFTVGTSVSVLAKPNMLHNFVEWREDTVAVFTEPLFPFTVTKDRVLVAIFEPKGYNITTEPSPPYGGNTSGGGTNLTFGDTITIYAEPNPNYHFLYWQEDTVIYYHYGPTYTFPVTRSRHLVAHFAINGYDITVSANPPHGGEVDGGGAGILFNDNTTVFAYPNPYFYFRDWTDGFEGDVLSVDPEFTFPVTKSQHLVANFICETFDVTVLASPAEGGEVGGGGNDIPYMTPITVYAIPDSCYDFVGWTVNGDTVSTIPYYTFEVTENITLTAHFVQKIFIVTAVANPPGGGILSMDTAFVACGTEIDIIATPNTGYIFLNWTKDGIVVGEDSIITITVNDSCHLIANFEYKTFYIDLSDNPFGSGLLYTSGYYPLGMELLIKAVANPEFVFITWTENGDTISDLPDFTIIVDRNRSFVAHFEHNFFDITVSASPDVGGVVEGDTTGVAWGEWVTVKAIPNEEFNFVSWTEEEYPNFISYVSEYSFPVVRSRNLTANFSPKLCNVNLTAYPPDGGYLEGGGTNIPYGTPITIEAFPTMNYLFSHWAKDSVEGEMFSDDNPFSFTVFHSHNLIGVFIPKYYDINLSANPAPAGNVSGGGTNILYNQEVSALAEAKPNFVFVNWTEDGDTVSLSALYQFPVTRSRNLVANFTFETFNIILAAIPEEWGTIEGTEYNVPFGTEKTIKAAPKEPYYFVDWTKADGTLFSVDAEHKFPVTESLYLTATFTSEIHSVNLIPVPFEGGKLFGGGGIPHGKLITIYAIPDDCYEFIHWTDERDSIITTELEFQIVIEENRIFKAHFSRHNISVTTSANEPEWGTTTGEYIDIPCGRMVTVSAFPNEECSFVNWTKDDEVVSENSVHSFLTTGTCHLVANFAPNTYIITLLADSIHQGTVSEGGEAYYGSEFTASASPFTGFSFDCWTEDNMVVSTKADYTFIIEKSRTLVAHFEKTKCTVIVEVNDTIMGYATGSGKYDLNQTIQVRAFPRQGYQFANWTVDSIVVSNSSTYKFIVTENVTLVANFYALDFDTYAATLWNNTFMLNLRKLEDEYYDIVGCTWFKDDNEIVETNTIDEFSYSAGAREIDLLELAPTYYSFRLTTKDGTFLYSTRKILIRYTFDQPPAKSNLLVYPNPVASGNSFTIEGLTINTPIEVYSQTGAYISRTTTTDTTATLTLNLPVGIYIIRNHNKEAKITIIK